MRRKDTLVGCPMADGIRQLSDPSLPWPSDEALRGKRVALVEVQP